jgi:transposase
MVARRRQRVDMGWMPLSPDGIAMCQACAVNAQAEGEGILGRGSIIGVDLTTNVFQVHRAGAVGSVMFRKKLSRPQFARFTAEQPPSCVAKEACASAHLWARQMTQQGHEVRLIAPHYVKPFIKRQKNDAADAEAVVEAALRPTMRMSNRIRPTARACGRVPDA